MADLATQIRVAHAAGYTDQAIAAHLASDPTVGPQVATARQHGYSDTEIVGHLAGPALPAGGDALGRVGAPEMQAENRNWLQRQAQTAGNRATEAVRSGVQQADQYAQQGNTVGAAGAFAGGVFTGVGDAVGAFTGPAVDYNDSGAPDTPETRAQAAAHPFPLDPNHVTTNRERQDAAGNIAISVLPYGRVVDAAGAAVARRATIARRLNAMGPPVRPAAPAPRPMPPPASTLSPAEHVAARSLARNIEAGGQTVPEAVAAMDANPRALPFHVSPGLAPIAEAVAQGPGKGAAAVKAAVDDWRIGVPDHVADAIAEAHGTPGQDIVAKLAEIKKTRSAAANAGMQQFGNDVVALSPETTRQIADPFFAPALDKVAADAAASRDPLDRGFARGLQASIAQARSGNPDFVMRMRLEDVNRLKRALAQRAEAGYGAGVDTETRLAAPRFREAATGLRDDAAAQSEPYRNWLAQFGESSDHETAVKVGYEGLFGNKMANTPAGQKAALDELHTPNNTLQPSHAEGTIQALIMEANRTGDIAAIRRVLRGRDGRSQLRMALGEDKANALISSFDKLESAANTNNQVVGNSRTYGRGATASAEQQAEQGALGQIANVAADLPHTPAGAVVYGAKKILKAVASADRSVIGNPAANEIMGKALSDPAETKRLLTEAGLLRRPAQAPQVNMGATAAVRTPSTR